MKIPESKLKEISVTLHDACYAVRYNSIFEEPRKVLEATSNDVREMQRSKEKTFCCGVGDQTTGTRFHNRKRFLA